MMMTRMRAYVNAPVLPLLPLDTSFGLMRRPLPWFWCATVPRSTRMTPFGCRGAVLYTHSGDGCLPAPGPARQIGPGQTLAGWIGAGPAPPHHSPAAPTTGSSSTPVSPGALTTVTGLMPRLPKYALSLAAIANSSRCPASYRWTMPGS